MVGKYNPFDKIFRMAAKCLKDMFEPNVKLKLIGRRHWDGRLYNLPTCGEFAALIVGMFISL